MDKLLIRNDYSYFITDDDNLREQLWSKLRFRQKNYYFSPAYKQKRWDGYIDFFHKTKGYFLTGLLPEVRLALSYWGISYETVDERHDLNFIHSSIDDQFLNQWLPKGMKPVTLEDYQVDLVNQTLKYKRGIVKAPAGSGKTFIQLCIMKCLPPGTPTLLLASRKPVIRQNYKELLKWGFANVGRFDGENHEPNLITCSTFQSLHHLERLLPKFKALIVDEIHMAGSSQAIKAYKKLTGCVIRVGVSATPFKFETKKKKETSGGDAVQKYTIKGHFGPVFKTNVTETGELTTELLQKRGRLSQSKCFFYYIHEPKIPHDVYIDAVTNGIAQNWFFHQTVSRLAKQLTGRTLILVERLAHGDTLHQLIPNSLWIQGKDDNDTRDLVIGQLREARGNVCAIATSGIFSVAVDVFVHSIINAASGKASHDIIQRMGRGLRPADDKKGLEYHDFFFTINQYLEDHSRQRVKVLESEGHDITIKEIDF